MTKKKKELPKLADSSVLIDTHCHLDMDQYSEDLNDILERAYKNNVCHIVTIGIDLKSSQAAIQLAAKNQNISATVGIHPHDVDAISSKTYDSLGELCDKNRQHIVAYGEIGLDYVKQYSSQDNQLTHFANQLVLAKDLSLPIVIHDREAHDDTLRIISECGGAPHGGVMHCFSGDITFARKILDLGMYISFPGVVTFKNAHALQEVAKVIPLDKILIETDGPFLSPHPFRGKRNEPVNVLFIAEQIANLRGISIDEVAKATTDNACKVFNLPLNHTEK